MGLSLLLQLSLLPLRSSSLVLPGRELTPSIRCSYLSCRPDQQWSLLPVHGILSSILPAYHTYGPGGGWGGQFGMSFPAYAVSHSCLSCLNRTAISNLLRLTFCHPFPHALVLSISWMGSNSKQTKNKRILSDIHIHMRLKISASALDVRLAYIPTLLPKLVDPLFEKEDVVSFFLAFPSSRSDHN